MPIKRIEDLPSSQVPAVHTVDREALCVCISAQIGNLLSFIGCPNNMDANVVYEIAQMMIDTHPHITVDAIKTFFYEAKRGKFGFHYNKMDGTKLLMWYDQFVEEYYKQIDDMEYAKHLSEKDGRTTPLQITDEEGVAVDYNELLASFHGTTKEQMERDRKIKDIRLRVQNANMHLYNELPVAEADEAIEQAIIEELKANDLITF